MLIFITLYGNIMKKETVDVEIKIDRALTESLDR